MKLPITAVLSALTALAVTAAPVPKEKEEPLGPPTAEQLQKSKANLKLIGIALHGYNDAHNAMPRDVVDKDGKPLLSWRVMILPHLGEEELFKQFKLDEPWDSKTNKPLMEKIPKVYAPIRVKAKAGETFYQGFDGPDATFEAGKRLGFGAFTDGLSNTIMVVEASEPCTWTRPHDLPYDGSKPLPKLGGLFEGDFHVLMGDGSVNIGHGKKMDVAEFRKLVTKSDGMVMNHDKALGHEKK